MNGWIGCGECDAAFPCHEGRARCLRLVPRYFVLRAPPGRCEDCKAVAAEGRFEVPWIGITGTNEGMTVCAACKPKYLEGVHFVELESPCPQHSHDGIAWCREPRCAECPMRRKPGSSEARKPRENSEQKAHTCSGCQGLMDGHEEDCPERAAYWAGFNAGPPDFSHQPTSSRDAYLRRWKQNEAILDRALEGSGLVARDLMAEAFRVSGLKVPPEVYSHGPYRCGSCRDTGVWSTGIVCPACSVYGPQQPRDSEARKPRSAEAPDPQLPSFRASELPSVCPECKYDHDKEGPGAACLRYRTDADLAAECERRGWLGPRGVDAIVSLPIAQKALLAAYAALNEAFDLCVDLGGELDRIIDARHALGVLGRGLRGAQQLSLRSRKFLSETVKVFPWLGAKGVSYDRESPR